MDAQTQKRLCFVEQLCRDALPTLSVPLLHTAGTLVLLNFYSNLEKKAPGVAGPAYFLKGIAPATITYKLHINMYL